MKLRRKRSSGDEGYWKSFTDIMAGLLMVILLVLMLLLLYMTQMNKNTHEHDHDYDYSRPYDEDDDEKRYDDMYDRPPEEGGGGGGGGGVDDPGENDNLGVDNDYGHDKAAVLVTVVDEETRKPIKKEGIQFSLYNSSTASGKVMELNTYYPVKVGYKLFDTTKEGNFYLPEKVRYGAYTLHNMKAPKGYGIADDVSFSVSESRDWSDPYRITVPMSPSKSNIYIQTIDADTKKGLGSCVYEVYAEEDILTLDGTVRFKAGDKVDEIKCDNTGQGSSKKLYLGKYSVQQKTAVKYYAINTTPLSVELNYLNGKDKVYKIGCEKTRVVLTLLDEETKSPVVGAEFSVTGKENMKTSDSGLINITDFEKNRSYKITLVSLPTPYRMATKELSVDVDAKGLIGGKALSKTEMTAYIIRLTVSAKDQLFGNELSNVPLRLYDEKDTVVEEWSATGEQEVFDDLEPGTYTLEVNGDKSGRVSLKLQDKPGKQILEAIVWSTWDTIAIIGGIIVAALLVALIISLIRSRRKRKKDEEE